MPTYKTLPVSLILFSIINAGIIGIGRWDFGLETALSGRYTTFQSLGIIGTVMYWHMSTYDCFHDGNMPINKKNVFFFSFLAMAFTSLIVLCTHIELSIRPFRKTYFDRLDSAARQSDQMSEEQKRLFNADDVSNVHKYVKMLHNHNLGSSAFPEKK